jgi:predicted GIY-YIG superfamily endonuclease
MNPRSAEVVAGLDPSLQTLLAAPPSKPLELPASAPDIGIYLLSEGTTHLYVGRSNRIRKRLGNHCRIGASHRMAAFAFRLAREATGQLRATYKPEGSRAALMRQPEFVRAFEVAKSRIRAMDARVVAESDPVRQTILEGYVAMALGTRYNDFDTH